MRFYRSRKCNDIQNIKNNGNKSIRAYVNDNKMCFHYFQAIKDMDYIIKEKTFIEKLLNCECDNYLTESKCIRQQHIFKENNKKE